MSLLSDSLKPSAEIYPHTWDLANDGVYLIRTTEDDFVKASFLDQRMMTPQTKGNWAKAQDVRAAVDEAGLTEGLGFIFHVGHVGSTLVSRLIGGEALLSVREPTPLRVLAQIKADLSTPESYYDTAEYERDLTTFLKLWSRPFAPGQTPVIKATSFAAECAEDVVVRDGCRGALFMYDHPEVHLASTLAGPNSRLEAKAMAQPRLKRLHQRLGASPWRLHAMNEGARIAMGWASEMAALMAAAERRQNQVLWLDFDQFLAKPGRGLAAVFERFGVHPTPADIDALVTGPIMTQYAKAPEHAYDVKLRNEVLAAGRAENPGEIADGMAWLAQASKGWPVIRDAVAFAS
jgi:hypothetical protein